MKKVKLLPSSNFSFQRCFLHFKLRLPSICFRSTVFLFLAIVVIFYLRIAFFQHQSDKSISKAGQWRVFQEKRKNEWIKPRMQCRKVFNGGKELLRRIVRHRRNRKDPDELEMNCEAIMARHGEEEGGGITELERQMPIAFARVVYTDYIFLEAELLNNYVHNNWYCYVLDSKSPATFQLRMRQLASCFDNVIIVDQMFDIDRFGTNMNKAMMECVRTLNEKPWKYLVTLQNHDVQAKTNAEMAQIFTWLGGINDIEVELQLPLTRKRFKHYQKNFNWTFDALHLFKDEAMNHRTDKDGQLLALSLSKGYMTVSLTKEFVDFVVKELNVTTLLEQLNKGVFGVDEHFWQSLSSSESLDAPGGFPHECYVKGVDEKNTSFRKYKYITRFAMWADPSSKCLSGNWRHAVCVFGLEDLMGPDSEIRRLPHLFVNKLMQEFDFDAILCWHEWMREKRRSERMELDADFYKDWPQMRYQRERRLSKETDEHATEVDCDSGMVRLKKRDKNETETEGKESRDNKKEKEESKEEDKEEAQMKKKKLGKEKKET